MEKDTTVNVFLKCLTCGSYITSPSFAVIKKHFEKCQLKKSRISSTQRHPVKKDNDQFDDFIDNKTETVTFTQPSLVLQRYTFKRSKFTLIKSEPELEENGDDDGQISDRNESGFAKRKMRQNKTLPRPKISRLEHTEKQTPDAAVKRNEAWKLGFSLMLHKNNQNSKAQKSFDPSPKHSIVKCPYNCSIQLISANELISHFKVAHPDKYTNAVPRSKTTPTQSGEFIRDKLGHKRQKCEDCGHFFFAQYLARHRTIMHPNGVVEPENTFSCAYPGCNVKCKDELILKRHFVALHLQNSPYACNFPGCNVKCSSPWSLRNHMGQQHFEVPPTCSKCGVTCTNKRRLRVHGCKANVTKMQSGDYKLVELNGFWKIKSKSYTHIKLPMKPELCRRSSDTPSDGKYDLDKTNNYIDSLKSIDINAMIRSDPGFIQACKNSPGFDKMLFGDESLSGTARKKHLNIYQCSKCRKMLTGILSFREHYAHCKVGDGDTTQTSTGLTSHNKGYFESEISSKFIRDKHRAKRFKCDKCGRFFTRCYLATHKANVHPNGTVRIKPKPDIDKPFSCAYPNCETKCKDVIHLKLHFIFHLKTNPYSCKFPGCNVKCNSSWRFKLHMIRVHCEAPITCTKCGVTYSNTNRLSRHDCEANMKKLQSGDYKLVEVGGFWKLKLVKYMNSALNPKLISTASVDKMELDEVNRIIKSLKGIDINAIIRADSGFIQACKDDPGFGVILLGNKRFSEISQPVQKKRSKIYKCLRCPTTFTGLHGFMEHNAQCTRSDIVNDKTNLEVLRFAHNDEQEIGVKHVKIEPELTIVPDDDVVNERENQDFHTHNIIVKHE